MLKKIEAEIAAALSISRVTVGSILENNFGITDFKRLTRAESKERTAAIRNMIDQKVAEEAILKEFNISREAYIHIKRGYAKCKTREAEINLTADDDVYRLLKKRKEELCKKELKEEVICEFSKKQARAIYMRARALYTPEYDTFVKISKRIFLVSHVVEVCEALFDFVYENISAKELAGNKKIGE